MKLKKHTVKPKKQIAKLKNKLPPKIALARLKNEYFRRYFRVAKALGALEVYKKFSEMDRKLLWLGRVRAIRVEAEKGVKIRPLFLDFIRQKLSQLAKITMTSIVEGGQMVTLEDYFTAGVMLGIFTRGIRDNEHGKTDEEIEEIKRVFKPLARSDRYTEPYTRLIAIGITLSRVLSRPTSKIYSMRHDVCFIDSFTSADSLMVNVTTAPCKYLTIDGISRQCFHLCWPGMFSNFMWGVVPGITLGIEGPFAKLKLDLYIQPHALHRFRERTESVEVTLRYLALYESFDFPKFHNVRPGISLLEYRIYDTLIGYFRVEAVCGVALIRTFLFVTNTGTPEGDRLNHILGACKADKEYIGIDKISTLVTTDLLQNSNLRAAFIEAGLEPLILYCEKLSSKTKCKKGFSSFFDRYMGYTNQISEKQKEEIDVGDEIVSMTR